ncbi:MAG TPA: YmfL family putative regulatory protein [Thiobacillus sp.]
MDIRQSYLAMIRAFPGGWDAIVGALGMSRDALENRIYERKGQGVLVETALQIQKFSDTTHFAAAVATASGGTFVKLPTDLSDANEALLSKFQALYAELGTFSAHFSSATADDHIDAGERKVLEADGARIHKVLSELMAITFRIYCPQAGQARGEQ